jgi:hypothetical protein
MDHADADMLAFGVLASAQMKSALNLRLANFFVLNSIIFVLVVSAAIDGLYPVEHFSDTTQRNLDLRSGQADAL